MKALRLLAGPRARRLIAERGLRPDDVRVIPAAAGGPKGLALLPLDAFLFGDFLPRRSPQAPPVHLVGASIGAWRMSAASTPQPVPALKALGEAYITQHYEHEPGRMPAPAHISAVFAGLLRDSLQAEAPALLEAPATRLHVIASRPRGPLRRPGRLRTPLAMGAAALGNLAHRQAMGAVMARTLFSDARSPLPFRPDRYPTTVVPLSADNLVPAVQASCAIPFWMAGVEGIPGAPPGVHWDGGLVDYHLHWSYAALDDGLAVYPHTLDRVIPGWLDQKLRWRHRATPALDNLLLLTPNPAWVATLPGGKLPDRQDFITYGEDEAGRIAAWRRALAECQRLADELAEAIATDSALDIEPLS